MFKMWTAVILFLFFQLSSFAAWAVIGAANDTSEDPFEQTTISLSRELSSKLRSINIISGVPLASDQDTTGGFGDVAANVIAALNFKEKYPDLKVTLLVTTKFKEHRNGVRPSSEIVKLMIPELDPQRMDQIQSYKDVNVIFLSVDEETLRSGPVPKELLRVIPQADLSLQFAANNVPSMELARETGKVAFSFYEFESSREYYPVVEFTQDSLEEKSDKKPWLVFQSGTEAAGIYRVSLPKHSRVQTLSEIEHWANSGADTPLSLTGKKLAVAYSNAAKSSLNYANGLIRLAQKNPHESYVLFVKNNNYFQDLNLPENLEVKLVSAFPHEVLQQLILEADLPPLVTGDSSFSIALSSLERKRRLFMYDAPKWKLKFIGEFTQKIIDRLKITSGLNLEEQKLLYGAMDFRESRFDASESAEEFALRFFEADNLHKKASDSLVPHIWKKDIYRNTRLIYEFYVLFE